MSGAVHTVDRTGWPAGPWDGEPDKLEWRDEATGRPCLIVRNPRGALCGYVGVDAAHPWHGVGYSACAQKPACSEDAYYCDHTPTARVSVHGGLTYSDACHGSICHVPAPGEADDVWWFGFDCLHHMDLAPGNEADGWNRMIGTPTGDLGGGTAYRDVAYVKAEVAKLAQQIHEVRA